MPKDTGFFSDTIDNVTATTSAEDHATTATTQAGIATTQAGIATTKAGIATTQAAFATTQAGLSLASAINASDSASDADDALQTLLDISLVDWAVTGAEDIHADRYTDTVYTHPATHSISEVSELQTALDNKVDDTQILTDVPSGAVFTDTTYTAGTNVSIDAGVISATDTNTGDVNVQSDWSQATTTEDDFIKNKPTIPTALANITDAASGVAVDDGITIDDTKVPKVFTQTDNPTAGTFEAGDLWWDTDGYTCRIAVLIGSSLAWFST